MTAGELKKILADFHDDIPIVTVPPKGGVLNYNVSVHHNLVRPWERTEPNSPTEYVYIS